MKTAVAGSLVRLRIATLAMIAACGRTGLDDLASSSTPPQRASSSSSASASGLRDASMPDVRVIDASSTDAFVTDARVTDARVPEADVTVDAPRGAPEAGIDASADHFVRLFAAPRPLAPLSTSRVTRRRPTLRWVLPEHVPDATVDLCFDRDCTRPIVPSAHVVGSSYTPEVSLPVGVVYWRLHPGTMTAVFGPTWQFTVGDGDPSVDSSWGTSLDLDGDGYTDLAVGSTGGFANEGVSVFFGSPAGPSETAFVVQPPAGTDGFGLSVASAGDIDGDGYADLIVASAGVGSAYLYYGSSRGVTGAPAATLTQPDGTADFGWTAGSLGDIDGDGYADVYVVGDAFSHSSAARVYVYLGRSNGLRSSPSAVISVPGGPTNDGEFTWALAAAGDVNGDGFADLVVSSHGTTDPAGTAYVYLGSASGLGAMAANVIAGPASVAGNTMFGEAVVGGGDVNGDGYADIVVLSMAGNDAVPMAAGTLFLGGPGGVGATAAGVVTVSPSIGIYGPIETIGASAGDINGDGYADLVLSFGEASVAGVFLGGPGGLASSPAATFGGAGVFPTAVSSAGDVNGDGISDLVIATSGGASTPWTADIYLGTRAGLPVAPSYVLTGAIGNQEGISVFGASD